MQMIRHIVHASFYITNILQRYIQFMGGFMEISKNIMFLEIKNLLSFCFEQQEQELARI